jgi:hypothetical protein
MLLMLVGGVAIIALKVFLITQLLKFVRWRCGIQSQPRKSGSMSEQCAAIRAARQMIDT